jgi:hypothetical protein
MRSFRTCSWRRRALQPHRSARTAAAHRVAARYLGSSRSWVSTVRGNATAVLRVYSPRAEDLITEPRSEASFHRRVSPSHCERELSLYLPVMRRRARGSFVASTQSRHHSTNDCLTRRHGLAGSECDLFRLFRRTERCLDGATRGFDRASLEPRRGDAANHRRGACRPQPVRPLKTREFLSRARRQTDEPCHLRTTTGNRRWTA